MKLKITFISQIITNNIKKLSLNEKAKIKALDKAKDNLDYCNEEIELVNNYIDQNDKDINSYLTELKRKKEILKNKEKIAIKELKKIKNKKRKFEFFEKIYN